ncbi:MAG TPA: hypothetical protein VHH11_14105 [Gammaproteobacteria bacterium]|nr:hypothetical protein [Gammaproteobacteria bacterium]
MAKKSTPSTGKKYCYIQPATAHRAGQQLRRGDSSAGRTLGSIGHGVCRVRARPAPKR